MEVFAGHVPAGSSLLELGCGAGRMTKALLERGFRVTAVDNSGAMLASLPPHATRVLADIESLDLRESFDVVLMASCLINVHDDASRAAQLASCRRHLQRGGTFVFQRHDPRWLLEAAVGPAGRVGAVTVHLESAQRAGDTAGLTLRYEEAGNVWRHAFTVRALDEEAATRALAVAGFSSPRWLDERRTWGLAAAL